MSLLDDYLTEQFHEDRQAVRELEATIGETCQTLLTTFDSRTAWPYRIAKDNLKSKQKAVSHSTTAMVALALQKSLGNWRDPANPQLSQPIDFPYFAQSSGDETNRARAEKVVAAAVALLREDSRKAGKVSTKSGTYGDNDPITLSFLASLIAGSATNGQWDDHRDYVTEQLDRFIKLSPLNSYGSFFNFPAEVASEPVPNALVPLRIVQAARYFLDRSEDLSTYRRYFETTLHDQLSFSSIPDSRFDPAELAFCLEGLLLAQKNVVDRPLFNRVLEVLAGAQEDSAFWRPTKPFLATDRGLTLFPVSVEVANSLLRSCEAFDGNSLRNTVGSANIRLFRRYWQWLNARKIKFSSKMQGGADGDFVGWDSEHVNQIDFIHIWESSQVLEFLVSFHRLLRVHIARTSLTLSGFDVRPAKKPQVDWTEVAEASEPVSSLGDWYRIYNRIGVDFVETWLSGDKKKSYSMLLYGPPGTGKTTVAENLSTALGFPLITITVSDFLAGGEGQVEARAKAIFEVLEAQSDCIVLFDEIDAFLLDRDSKRYADQETVFQFMTPGMLTKINNLRKAARLIFIIATNYENRIDPAIKRTGRIDRHYLLLPYDKLGRNKTIHGLMYPGASRKKVASTSAEKVPEEIITSSLFLGWGDLRNIVKKPVDAADVGVVADELRKLQRTTRLSSFANRLPDSDGKSIEEKNKWPVEEFLCLVALALEGEDAFGRGLIDEAACRGALNAAGGSSPEQVLKFVESNAPRLPSGVQKAVADYLETIAKEPE